MPEQAKPQFVKITEENKDQYSIEDVVMPIIGYEVPLPENESLREIYQEIMNKDNISLDNFKSHSQSGITSAKGSYRRMLGAASDIKFDVVRM